MSSRVLIPPLVLCLFMVGCEPTSEQPVSDPETAQPDRRLFGSWHCPEAWEEGPNGRDSVFLHIGRNNADVSSSSFDNFAGDQIAHNVHGSDLKKFRNHIAGVWVVMRADGELVSMKGLFFATPLKASSYANVPWYWGTSDDPKRGYFLWRYTVESDQLKVWPSNQLDSILATAIRDGRLKGIVSGKPPDDGFVTVTDSSENLHKFLNEHGDALIAKQPGLKFHRITRQQNK